MAKKSKADVVFFNKVVELCKKYAEVFDHNEESVCEYMKNRWPAAYMATTKALLPDEDELPNVTLVADFGYRSIDNYQKYLSDLNNVCQGLLDGGLMLRGEFL